MAYLHGHGHDHDHTIKSPRHAKDLSFFTSKKDLPDLWYHGRESSKVGDANFDKKLAKNLD